MNRTFARVAGVCTTATVAAVLAASSANAAPSYGEQYGSTSVGICTATITGASRSDHFVGVSQGNTGCGSTDVEVEYRDLNGVQQVLRAHADRAVSGEPPVAQINMLPGTFSSIQGVIGSGSDFYFNTTPGVYLYW